VEALLGQTDSTTGHVRLRYWASARAAAGLEEDVLEVSGPVSLASLRERARELHAGSRRFSDVIDTCSVLLDDRPVGSSDPASVLVAPGQTVEFLPPFAGG
jgi:molybdopterin converting factor small subunit